MHDLFCNSLLSFTKLEHHMLFWKAFVFVMNSNIPSRKISLSAYFRAISHYLGSRGRLDVDNRSNYNSGQNVWGHLRKLGIKTHFAKLTHILPLKKAWGCCYKGLFLLSPSPPSSVDCVELKLEYITSTLHWEGRGGGKMPQFEELLR